MDKEPAAIVTAIGAFVAALAALLAAFGLDLSPEQQRAIIGMIAPTVAIIGLIGWFIRKYVYSPKTTQAIADRAATTGNTDIGSPPAGK